MKLTFLYNTAGSAGLVKSKFLLVMKLTTILLLIGILHVSAASNAQSVTISRHNTTLETVLKDIRKQTGYLYFYNGEVNINSPVPDVNLKNATLEQALDYCLANLDLSYTIVNKTIVIRKKAAEAGSPAPAEKAIKVKGKVVDSKTGESIPLANITLKGNKDVSTHTNDKGEFEISASPGDVLVFTFVGYKPREVKVADAKYLTIKMEVAVNAISGMVFTGYQTIKKDNYTGTAITIKGDDLKRVNPQDVIKAIATFDPSFKIASNDLLGSDPNSMPKITIRGSTTLPNVNGSIIDRNNLSSTYNLPVFILDGFEVQLQDVVDMDINRIATVTILKDAAATAVYGSRAANGVIVITTKVPLPGKLRLSYDYELTVQAPDLSGYHLLNAAQKLQYEKLAGLYISGTGNSGLSQEALDEQYNAKLRNVVSGVNTYWLSQPLQNAYQQKHSLYAEGGDSTFRYGITLRYQTNPGVMKGSTRNRYSGGMDFTYNPNQSLIFKNAVTFSQVDATNSKYGDFSTYAAMNPYFPKTDAQGNLIREIANWVVTTSTVGQNGTNTETQVNVPVLNPLYEASLGNFDKNSYQEIIDEFSIDWKITQDLRFKALMSVNDNKATADKFVSPFSNTFYFTPADQIENRGSYDYSTNNDLRLDGTASLNYNKQMGDHAINVVLGSNITYDKSDFKGFEARGFSNDRFTNIGFARTYTPDAAPTGNVAETRLAGAFLTGNYAFQNKYLLDATYRLDGSSLFGTNNRVAQFWSTGLGWNAHKEDFIKDNFPGISRLKFSATTGSTGSVSFPPYLATTTYNYQTSNWYSTGVGATVNNYGNANLQWQKTDNYDLSLELGLFHDRVLINPHYYYKLTHGLVNSINIAPSTGFNTYEENIGDMGNKGIELYLTVNAVKTTDLNVNVFANYSYNKNTIVKISDALKAYNDRVNQYQDTAKSAQATPLLRFAEGQSINTIYGIKSKGIDPENGKEIYVKKDGSLTYTYDVNDIQPIGNSTPKGYGHFGSNITYKQFYFSFSFGYTFGGDYYNQTLVDKIENADPRNNVDIRALTERWQKPGDIALFKNIADLGTTYTSSRFIQKENTLDLESVTLSYDFKKNIANKIGMQSLRLSLTGNDIAHISDIQAERGTEYPYARSLTCSLQATF